MLRKVMIRTNKYKPQEFILIQENIITCLCNVTKYKQHYKKGLIFIVNTCENIKFQFLQFCAQSALFLFLFLCEDSIVLIEFGLKKQLFVAIHITTHKHINTYIKNW